MLFFPFLYDDELLYSVIARYHQYSGNDNSKTTMGEVFGSNNACASTIFPAQLNALIQRLPDSDTYTSNDLITNHTFLPYYSPFIPENRYQELEILMKENNGTTLYMKLGKTASAIKSPKILRYCLECITDDKSNNGEAYWHRTHQVEGVKLCPRHQTWLIESAIPYAERKNKHEFISLEQIICNAAMEINTKTIDLEFEHLKFIAEQTHYLLNNRIDPFGMKNLNKFYVNRLQQKGLATVSGRIRWLDLIPMFNQFYGEKLLSDLNCFIDKAKEDTWLHKMLRKPRVSCHPLRHILFLGFLGETISSMENQIKEISYEPFGRGPWLCLNKASEHYQKPVITSCIITRDYKTGLPVGTFSCSCGFVYSRKGPDETSEDCFKIGRIKVFGLVWERKLSELAETDLSLRKKAELLGVDIKTVKKKLVPDESIRGKIITDNKTEEYRANWIELIQSYSEKSITEIRTFNPKIYTWLYRNDKEWLRSNYPETKKSNTGNFKKRVDWDQRDQETVREMELIVKEILSETNKLIRVTANEISRRLGMLSSLRKNLDKMPNTKKVLNESVESIEQFQIRRIKYVISSMRKTSSNIKEWQVIRAVGLKREYAEKLKNIIQQEIYG